MRFDIPWSGEVNRLQNELDRYFGNRSGRPPMAQRAYPPVNMWEDDDNLYIESEIPGMDLDQLELLAGDANHMTLQGERKQPGDADTKWHRQERGFGRFSRMVALPTSVDAGQATADYNAGVLTVTLPKKEEAKPRKISVNAG